VEQAGHHYVMRSAFGRGLATMVLLGTLALAALWFSEWLSARGFNWASEFSSVASLVLAVATVLGPLLARVYGWLRGPRPISSKGIVRAADDLALVLGRQWVEEERLRRVNDPGPLPVRWEVTAAAAAAMPGVPRGDAGVPWHGLSGQFGDILSVFYRVPSRRLVILGRAGAGKSVLAIKLASELLAARKGKTGMPVPVIFSAATWDAGSGLFEWIAGQLIRSHPGLALRVKDATGEVTTVSHALALGGVLPILDGFDELPEDLRAAAITKLNAAGSDLPLVVTSRPEEYSDAVAAVGRAISRAGAVELLPLGVPEVKAYLGEATAVPAGRWQTVFERLDAEPDGALTQVLTTPLMLWLGRTVYKRSDSDPGELADVERFGHQKPIEHHLLDAFVPVVYASGAGVNSRFRWRWQKARRWLAFLAAYLDRTGSPDLAWWRLLRVVRWLWPVGVGIRAGLKVTIAWGLAVWVLWRAGDWRRGGYYNHGSLLNLLLSGPLGHVIRPVAAQIAKITGHQVRHALDTLHSTPIAVLLSGSLPSLAISVALLMTGLSIIFGTSLPMSPRQPSANRVNIVSAAGNAVIGMLYLPVLAFGAVALLVAVASRGASRTHAATVFTGMPSTWLTLLLLALYGFTTTVPWYFTASLDVTRSISPAGVLRLDRRATLLGRLIRNTCLTAMIWLCCGKNIALAYGIYAATTTLTWIPLGRGFSASGKFADTRIWLACGRRMPWRAMSFLADAHQRGVLRQAGAVYQFRHIRLQQQLKIFNGGGYGVVTAGAPCDMPESWGIPMVAG
jgi:hypothetical protein